MIKINRIIMRGTKMKYSRKCEICNLEFKTIYEKKVDCSVHCKKIKLNNQMNEKWIKRDRKEMDNKKAKRNLNNKYNKFGFIYEQRA